MNKVLTDNSFLENKVKLRIRHLPGKKEIKVLDCFAGKGIIWKKIQERSKKEIKVLGIDIKNKSKQVFLQGNNLKFLPLLNLENYDIIDLDAYGVPFSQLEIIFKKKPKKFLIFGTFNQTIYGGLPYKMLERLGYSKKMIRKCPTLFFRNGWEKFKNYLACEGISLIHYLTADNNRKNYFLIKKI